MTGRVLVTGGSGVLGRAAVPRLRRRGCTVDAPARADRALLDPAAARHAVRGAAAVLHLASRIPLPARAGEAGAWMPDGGPVPPHLRSAADAERAVPALEGTATRGVVLRPGPLHGPGAWTGTPDPRRGATLRVDAAGEALARALGLPGGVHVVADPAPAAGAPGAGA
ncbi:NAD-dependent epimerase/dehydratase family protein [Miltoncostaea marina]|uniref:NAD-dependent epimerase/dehydratase family protein n=1 Tax=Miltoncostaea marina TaxID=2843215 RepID=UPI001C3C37D2|nr:NAD-dependent epimerase/dehydratase family protein [Miltoncostaea marina]